MTIKHLGPFRVLVHSHNHRPGEKWEATGSLIKQGSVAVDLGDDGQRDPTLRIEWSLGDRFCHLESKVHGVDRKIQLSAAVPGAAVWWTMGGLPDAVIKALRLDWKYPDPSSRDLNDCSREVGVSIHSWALWWNIWSRENEWRSSDPKWMSGNFQVVDAFFGKMHYEKKLLSSDKVTVAMPEKSYTGTVELFRSSWTRPRMSMLKIAPFHRELQTFVLDMDEPIPFPGKGENSWDGGEDALYSISGTGDYEDAIASAVKSVLRDRRRYGGSLNWKPEPKKPRRKKAA